MTIDVIIVTRNRPSHLTAAVTNILSGRQLPTTIIVIDSSNPIHVKIRDKLFSLCTNKGVRLKYLRIRHKGISYARNCGILASESDYICFIDDDEFPDRHWMSNIRSLFGHNRSMMALFGPKRMLYPQNYWNKVWDVLAKASYPKNNTLSSFVSAGNSCYNRLYLVHNKIRFDERMSGLASEDTVFSRLLFQHHTKVYHSRKIAVKHAFRTNIKDFIIQWFYYGMSTFHCHKLYDFPNYKSRHTGLKIIFTSLYTSIRSSQPSHYNVQFLPGIIVKNISFSFGYVYGLITGKQEI